MKIESRSKVLRDKAHWNRRGRRYSGTEWSAVRQWSHSRQYRSYLSTLDWRGCNSSCQRPKSYRRPGTWPCTFKWSTARATRWGILWLTEAWDFVRLAELSSWFKELCGVSPFCMKSRLFTATLSRFAYKNRKSSGKHCGDAGKLESEALRFRNSSGFFHAVQHGVYPGSWHATLCGTRSNHGGLHLKSRYIQVIHTVQSTREWFLVLGIVYLDMLISYGAHDVSELDRIAEDFLLVWGAI